MPPPFASLPAVGFALTAEIWVSITLSSVTVCPSRMPLAWGVPSKTSSPVAGCQRFSKAVFGQSAIEFQRFIGHSWPALNHLGGSICSGSVYRIGRLGFGRQGNIRDVGSSDTVKNTVSTRPQAGSVALLPVCRPVPPANPLPAAGPDSSRKQGALFDTVGACRIPKRVRVNLKALRPIGPFAEHGPILSMIGVRAGVAVKLLAAEWDPDLKQRMGFTACKPERSPPYLRSA